MSIYANAIDTLMSLDNAYDGMDNEVILGRRRTFVAEEMMKFDNGERRLTFDPTDISVYCMPKDFNKDSMIEHSDPSLRTEEYKNAVNFQLNILSSKVGFGQERYKFDGNSIQTATGVISENSDMFRTIKKHEQTLESSLVTIIQAISYASSVFGNYNIDASIITIDFDDSVIEDKGAERIRDMQEVSQGLRSKKSYLIKDRCMNEKQAEKELEDIVKEKQSNAEMFGFSEGKTKEE